MRCDGIVSAATLHARHVAGRLVEQERLLDLEADLDLLLTRPRQLLLRALALGDVFGDADQILRLPVGAENRDLDGVQVAQTSMGRLDGFLRDVHQLTAAQHRPVLRHEEAGLLLRKEIVVAPADGRAAVDAQRLFLGLVPAHEPQVLGVFDEEHDRQVLEHRVQEVPGVFEFSRPPRQRLLGPPVLGQFSFQLSVGLSQLRGQFVHLAAGASDLRSPLSGFANRAAHEGQPAPDRRAPCPRQRPPGELSE